MSGCWPITGTATSDSKTLYDEDFVIRSREQAAALRTAGRGATNQPLDWENLAEEIESLGKSDRRELASRLAVIIEHLAKLEHSPAQYPRNRRRQTIRRRKLHSTAPLLPYTPDQRLGDWFPPGPQG
jgi:hypothetical protein